MRIITSVRIYKRLPDQSPTKPLNTRLTVMLSVSEASKIPPDHIVEA